MTKPINMPKYGLQQDEGTIIEWRKKVGDRIEKGDILLELETDKAVFEYEAPEKGYLRHILAQNGDVVPVLSPIAILTDELDEPFDKDAFSKTSASTPSTEAQVEASQNRRNHFPQTHHQRASNAHLPRVTVHVNWTSTSPPL
ncbi:MAG: biotin/lipoyl-containing protein [Candidatus Latescibacterota bacterium]